MNRKRRTEITIERHQVTVVRGRQRPVRLWCPGCGSEAPMVRAEEAAALAGVSARTIYRWVEAGQIHYRETAEGEVLICLASLAAEAG